MTSYQLVRRMSSRAPIGANGAKLQWDRLPPYPPAPEEPCPALDELLFRAQRRKAQPTSKERLRDFDPFGSDLGRRVRAVCHLVVSRFVARCITSHLGCIGGERTCRPDSQIPRSSRRLGLSAICPVYPQHRHLRSRSALRICAKSGHRGGERQRGDHAGG
jgi:hypothetical protein